MRPPDSRVVRRLACGALTATLAALSAACGGDAGGVTADVPVAQVVVTPSADTLAPGEKVRLDVRARDAGGGDVRGAVVAWSTSSADVATVDASGQVRAVAPGLAVIAAVAGGARGEARLVVRRVAASLAVVPESLSLGESVALRAVLRDADGVALPDAPPLTSRDPAVVRIDGTAGARARSVGTATLAVTVEGRTLTAPMRVGPPRVSYVVFAIEQWIVPVGTSRPLDVGVFVGNLFASFVGPEGGRVDWPVEWRSSNPAAVAVDARGVVTGVAEGEAVVTATSGGVSGTARVIARQLGERLTFTAIAVGDRQSCALSTTGGVYCWGFAVGGRLGVTGPTERVPLEFQRGPMTSVPLPVASPVRFASLASGNEATGGCALTAEGEAYCWGLANGTDAPLRFASLSRGAAHACGLTAEGRAYCWGSNASGQLGIGTRAAPPPAAATPVAGDLRFASISAGLGTCGITLDADLYCWGHEALAPTRAAPGTKFRSVSTSGYNCAISAAGATYCWLGATPPADLGAARVDGGRALVAVAGRCGLDAEGVTYCWELDGARVVAAATPLAGAPPFRTIAGRAGSTGHACGLTAAGVAYCWGFNGSGEAGSGRLAGSVIVEEAGRRRALPFLDGATLPPTKVAGQP